MADDFSGMDEAQYLDASDFPVDEERPVLAAKDYEAGTSIMLKCDGSMEKVPEKTLESGAVVKEHMRLGTSHGFWDLNDSQANTFVKLGFNEDTQFKNLDVELMVVEYSIDGQTVLGFRIIDVG